MSQIFVTGLLQVSKQYIHVLLTLLFLLQLEASIKNGDIEGFQIFNKASVFLSSMVKKKDINLEEHEELFDEVSVNEVIRTFSFQSLQSMCLYERILF